MLKVCIYIFVKDFGVDNYKMFEIFDGFGVLYKSVSSIIDEENVEIIKQILVDEVVEGGDVVLVVVFVFVVVIVEFEEVDEILVVVVQVDVELVSDLFYCVLVVIIMGYVDYGKISLFDYICKICVVVKEVGGIIQYVGVFEVKMSKGKIVFIDIFGYEVFMIICVCGVNVVDIVIIVIVVDDSLMLQICEVIVYVQVVKVLMLIVINKVDLLQVDFEKVKIDFMQFNFVFEEYGGDVIVVLVSVKIGEGVEDLFEYILLIVEFEDLCVDFKGQFSGVIIEGCVDK